MRLAVRLLAVLCASFLYGCVALQGSAQSSDRPNLARVSIFSYRWTWTDERGESVNLGQWRGEPLVVSAIYTSCRATCPRTIGKLKKLDAEFRREGHVPQFVIVTLDPATDTPETLRQYKEAEHLPASWHLLAGSAAETQELADALDIHVMAMDAHTFHEARIVVFDAGGLPARSFSGRTLDDEAPAL
jgi:protein SCO1/2